MGYKQKLEVIYYLLVENNIPKLGATQVFQGDTNVTPFIEVLVDATINHEEWEAQRHDSIKEFIFNHEDRQIEAVIELTGETSGEFYDTLILWQVER